MLKMHQDAGYLCKGWGHIEEQWLPASSQPPLFLMLPPVFCLVPNEKFMNFLGTMQAYIPYLLLFLKIKVI
jgi:hypothetical protein